MDEEKEESSDEEKPPHVSYSVDSGVLLVGTKVIRGVPKPHFQRRRKWEEKMARKRKKEDEPKSSLSEEENEPAHVKWKEQKLKGWTTINHTKEINKRSEPSNMKKS